VGLEAFGDGANVDIENGAVQARLVFLGDERLLGGVHAEHRGAVIAPPFARTHTLNESDVLGRLLVGPAAHFSSIWSRGTEDALELQAGDHVGIVLVAILRL